MNTKKIDFLSDINAGYEDLMNYPAVDRFIIKIHWYSFVFVGILAFLASVVKIANTFPSPFSWTVKTLPEAVVTVIHAFLSALIPTLTVGKFKNHYLWRILVTLTLTIFSYLAVFISGGAIEMHFLFFAMIALMVVYSDWRLGWIMLVAVALHHGILNYVAPTWVYAYGRNDFSVVAHGLPVLITVIFTTILAENNRKSIMELQAHRNTIQGRLEEKVGNFRLLDADLENKIRAKTTEVDSLRKEIDQKTGERTERLRDNVVILEDANKYISERQGKIDALKREVDELNKQLLTKG